ncbi:serine hydrolase [Mucilaginibacter sp. Bleaf8]|uniref:serine hydrolase n=1 Tax=Mucilaginibacter sp. Bleaf8 TaxID=2834430 RepID=UPI001BCF3DD4|nr:serine hydrolase [Mucilaginibacter sp. Bleaf8]MBS7565873.1 serine hydrolase [Mucilaginibacter sp. Bleaf8]
MKKIYLFALICFTGWSATAQNINRNRFFTDSLDNYITRSLTNWRVPGAAICIVKDARIILRKGYGIKELGVNAKADENTLFMIGSNTKAFIATTLATLQAERKLSLDDKVTKYLPDFKLNDKAAGEMATIRDLLCHRIGFETFQGDFTYYTSNLSRKEVIEKMSHIKARYPFRSKWGYTNAAYVTAGEIVQKVTNKPWEVYVKESLLMPLGMSSTLTQTKDMATSFNKSAAHTIADGRLIAIPYAQLDNLGAAAAISSSATDMSKWLLALLSNGKSANKQVIPEAAIRATRQPQNLLGDDDNGGFVAYGLGWMLKGYKSHRMIMHTGGVSGFVSSVTLVPDMNLGIVILTNTDQNDLITTLNLDIIDAYLKMPFRSHSDAALTDFRNNLTQEQQHNKSMRDSTMLNLRPALSLNEYTGKYVSDVYGTMTISKGDNNDLEARFEHHPKMFARMQPLGGNRFYVTFSDPEFGKAVFPFIVQNNRVVGVQVKVADFVEYTPYEFRKK